MELQDLSTARETNRVIVRKVTQVVNRLDIEVVPLRRGVLGNRHIYAVVRAIMNSDTIKADSAEPTRR